MLLYQLEMSSTEDLLIAMARRTGQPIPDRIKNKPILLPGLDLYLQAFYDLDGERSYGMSIGRIPWSQIHNYANVYEFSSEQFDDLRFYITAMDEAHLSRIRSEQANK